MLSWLLKKLFVTKRNAGAIAPLDGRRSESLILPDGAHFRTTLRRTRLHCAALLESAVSQDPVSILRRFNPRWSGHPLFSIRPWDEPRRIPGGPEAKTVWYYEPVAENIPKMLRQLQDHISLSQGWAETAAGRGYGCDDVFCTPPPRNSNPLYPGRILLAEIDVTTHDGASEWESAGFIDIEDLPPIDTWFHILASDSSRFICAWIPEPFVHLADDGVQVNAVDSLRWLDEAFPEIYAALA